MKHKIEAQFYNALEWLAVRLCQTTRHRWCHRLGKIETLMYDKKREAQWKPFYK